jgi:hypothetical protein
MIRLEHTFPRVNAVLCRRISLCEDDFSAQQRSSILTLAELDILVYMLDGCGHPCDHSDQITHIDRLAEHVVRQVVFMASFHVGGGGDDII